MIAYKPYRGFGFHVEKAEKNVFARLEGGRENRFWTCAKEASTGVLIPIPLGPRWRLQEASSSCNVPSETATEKAHFKGEILKEMSLFIIEYTLKDTLRTKSNKLITDILIKLSTEYIWFSVCLLYLNQLQSDTS